MIASGPSAYKHDSWFFSKICYTTKHVFCPGLVRPWFACLPLRSWWTIGAPSGHGGYQHMSISLAALWIFKLIQLLSRQKVPTLGVTSKLRWLQLRLFAAICKRWQYYFFNSSHCVRSIIGTYCFTTMIYAYLNE